MHACGMPELVRARICTRARDLTASQDRRLMIEGQIATCRWIHGCADVHRSGSDEMYIPFQVLCVWLEFYRRTESCVRAGSCDDSHWRQHRIMSGLARASCSQCLV